MLNPYFWSSLPVAEFSSLLQIISISRWNRFGILSFIRWILVTWITRRTWWRCKHLLTIWAAFIVPLIQHRFDFNLAVVELLCVINAFMVRKAETHPVTAIVPGQKRKKKELSA